MVTEDLAQTIAALEAWETARQDLLLTEPSNVYRNLALLLRSVRDMMSALGRPYIELPEMSATLRPAALSARITDLAALPDQYVDVVRRPRMEDIVADLEAGVVIPGAQLLNRIPQLRIKA